MSFLLDEGLPRGAAAGLRTVGHKPVHVVDEGLSGATGQEIINSARRSACVVVTLDAGFHALMALSGARSPSCIRIRTQGMRGHEIAACVQRVTQHFQEEISRGALVSVSNDGIRLRRLPIEPTT